MSFQSIRGTFDVLPDASESGGSPVPGSAAWRHVEVVVRGVMERFAFEEIRTPILEPLELVARGVGGTTDIVSKEMFAVERTKETYVLRPEITAPVMRAYLQHHLDQRGGAQRLYYLGPCFRAERPQKGRFRQFHQFGTELIGSDDSRADVETIANLRAVYDAFGVTGTRLRLNTLGDAADRPAYRAALQDHFAPHIDALSEASRQRLDANPLRILDTKDERERALLADAPRLTDFVNPEARDHYETVKGLLDDLGVPYVEDPLLVRGLDYYTRTVFELESDDLGAQSALAAGGRYDGLAEAVGSKKPVPAVGYAAGFERAVPRPGGAGLRLPRRAPPRRVRRRPRGGGRAGGVRGCPDAPHRRPRGRLRPRRALDEGPDEGRRPLRRAAHRDPGRRRAGGGRGPAPRPRHERAAGGPHRPPRPRAHRAPAVGVTHLRGRASV